MNESEKIDPRELSPLALAFVGDSVLELLVRQRLVEHHRLSAGKLNAEKVKYVSARAQFREEQLLEPLFTEEELAVFKRGRNASKASVAKHASPEEYRASTGFECLLGWLYLSGQLERRATGERQSQVFIEAPYRNAKLLGQLLEVCAPDTRLTLAVDITSPQEYIRTLTVREWRSALLPEMDKRPAIFILG